MEQKGLEFPCQFPLKTIGKNTGLFQAVVVEIVRRHVPELEDSKVTSRLSRDGKYLAVTTTFVAQSREQLDGLYSELGKTENVMMVL